MRYLIERRIWAGEQQREWRLRDTRLTAEEQTMSLEAAVSAFKYGIESKSWMSRRVVTETGEAVITYFHELVNTPPCIQLGNGEWIDGSQIDASLGLCGPAPPDWRREGF